MSFPGLTSTLSVNGQVFSVQTESTQDEIRTVIFLGGESILRVSTPYDEDLHLMALIRLGQKQHQSIEKRCARGEFCRAEG